MQRAGPAPLLSNAECTSGGVAIQTGAARTTPDVTAQTLRSHVDDRHPVNDRSSRLPPPDFKSDRT
ncbi:hypothetical protein BZL29_5707 [Mycobacterium kansasii]|uniref:Uncharacterized protein n=1 Tax=Mycobacterium kansasii TaxID=1768 RepID=A0A1V3WXF7_MYCKA|nr:hypothetical protein BZL29_5707 [Mycobacterium kansasii]